MGEKAPKINPTKKQSILAKGANDCNSTPIADIADPTKKQSILAKGANDCNTTPIADIADFCGHNLTGLLPAMYASKGDGVEAIPAPDAVTNLVPSIQMAATKVFNRWGIFQKENGLKSENLGDEEESQGLKYTVDVLVQQMDPVKSKIMSAANGMKGVFLVEDKNKQGKRVIGEPGNLAVLKISEQTEGRNGYKGVITWETNDFAPWLDPAYTVPV